MTGWYLAVALYAIGFLGLRATGRDLNGGPWKTWRPAINLLFWPLTVSIAALGDTIDWMQGKGT